MVREREVYVCGEKAQRRDVNVKKEKAARRSKGGTIVLERRGEERCLALRVSSGKGDDECLWWR